MMCDLFIDSEKQQGFGPAGSICALRRALVAPSVLTPGESGQSKQWIMNLNGPLYGLQPKLNARACVTGGRSKADGRNDGQPRAKIAEEEKIHDLEPWWSKRR